MARKWMPWYVYVCELGFLGKLPLAPGTWGSAGSALVYWGLLRAGTPEWLLGGITVLLVAGSIPLSNWASLYMAQRDPSNVVIDELVGQWTTYVPYLWVPVWVGAGYSQEVGLLAGFFVFRFFDVLKVFPANLVEELPGGWGIVLDDVAAGVYANVALWLVGTYLL